MHQRTALDTREDGAIDLLFERALHQDQATARAAQTLVGGRGDNVRVRHRVGIDACCNQARIVGNVHHHDGAYRPCDGSEAFEIDA